MRLARHFALALMVVVSGWSLWAWAESKPTHAGASAAVNGPAEHHEAAAGREAAGEREEPAPINWFEFGKANPPFIATIVNFGILAAGYYLLGRKPIAVALQKRRDSIGKEIEEAERMRREAEARAKTYQAKLDQLEEEVRRTREALLRTGEAERDRIVADAEAKAERMRKDAEFLVLQEVKQLRQDLLRDTLESAIAAAEELLKNRVSLADQERLAEDYLNDLGGKPRADRTLDAVKAADPGSGTPS